MERKILEADEGYIYTDGEVYGKIIYLALDRNEEDFYQITEKEYDEIVQIEMPNDVLSDPSMFNNIN